MDVVKGGQNFRNVLRVEQLASQVDQKGYKRKRGEKNDTKFWGLSN